MAESWFSLSRTDQAEALEVAAAQTGRPPHLLEKDIWVVWTLSAIYKSHLSKKLTFKGGTSLSKVYQIIDRFSEDIDLTYDIREVVPDLLQEGNPIPTTSSQAKKITDKVRARLPDWVESQIKPILISALQSDGLEARLTLDGIENEKLVLSYQPIKLGTGYAPSTIQLEFGARATGQPHHPHLVSCDMAPAINGIEFPIAYPLVMDAERTFWEKATAAHVYCRQARLRGERYSRHWYDLAAMSKSGHAQTAIADRQLAQNVAQHKSMFFAEKDTDKNWINYTTAVSGGIQLVPQGAALESLAKDYFAMLEDGLLQSSSEIPFSEIMDTCADLESAINSD